MEQKYNFKFHVLKKHIPFIAALVFLSELLMFLSFTGGAPKTIFLDPIRYQTTAKYIIEHGTFIKAPLSYEEFSERGPEYPDNAIVNYPCYGYSLLLAATSLATGEYSLLNGVKLNIIIMPLLAFACYWMMYSLCRKRLISASITLAVLFNPQVSYLSAVSRPDLLLLLLTILAVMSMLKGKHALTALILGVGFLFREHALMFLPFMLLLSPRVTSFKNFMLAGIVMVAAFIPFWATKYVLKLIFTPTGQVASDYYNVFFTWIQKWFTVDAIGKFFINCWDGLFAISFVLGALIIVCITRPKLFPKTARRLILVASIFILIPCIMWTAMPNIKTRYFVYTLPLLWAAFVIFIAKYNWKKENLIVGGIILIAILTNLSPYINKFSFSALGSPARSIQVVAEYVDLTKDNLYKYFKPGSVLMVKYPPIPAMSLDDLIMIQMVDYDVFLEGKRNHEIDGLVFFGKNYGFPKTDFVDKQGNKFKRIFFHIKGECSVLQKEARLCRSGYLVFKRMDSL